MGSAASYSFCAFFVRSLMLKDKNGSPTIWTGTVHAEIIQKLTSYVEMKGQCKEHMCVCEYILHFAEQWHRKGSIYHFN